MNRILITGASGNIGKRVAELLSGSAPLRLMGRTTKKLPELYDAEKVSGDYSDLQSLNAAFEGILTAFIVSGYAEPGKRALLHKNAIDAAAKAGVTHLVYLSFQGASPDSKFPMSVDHFQTEEFIKASGIPYTLLRDNFYMDLLPEMFGEQHRMKGPGGQGKVAWVAREDAAQCVAKVLQNPSAFAGTYDLTGPEALSLSEAAQRLSRITGQSFLYQQETVAEGRAWRNQLGAPDWEVDTWIGSYVAIAENELAQVSGAVEQITGRPPVALEAYFKSKPELLQKI